MKTRILSTNHPDEKGTIMKSSKVQIITVAIAAIVAGFALPVLAMDDRTDLLEVNAKNFSRPTIIDNKYMPLKPGSSVVYEGWTIDDEDKKVPHKVIHIVTDLVKEINGIETVIIWERDIVNGKLEESELAFRAQDDKGNVWHFGEVKEVYDENLKLVGGKVWMEGRLGAKAGIIMPAQPRAGQAYLEEFSLGNAEDVSEILSANYAFGNDPGLDRFVPRAIVGNLRQR